LEGTKVILDLGCGGRLETEDAVGVDIVGPPNTRASIICNLGFEDIPVDDNSCELVVSHHFIEHLPFAVWYREEIPEIYSQEKGLYTASRSLWKRHLPVVQVFNEVYRVLDVGGIFKVTVPLVVNGGFAQQPGFQDITHVSFWTPETVRYLSGDYYSFHNVYGHTSRFELTKFELEGWFMRFELTARKDLPQDYPYLLKYEEGV
jgi:predicted SAM-dependent methyltransferase